MDELNKYSPEDDLYDDIPDSYLIDDDDLLEYDIFSKNAYSPDGSEYDRIMRTGHDELISRISDKSDKEAFLFLQDAVQNGESGAKGLLADFYMHGIGTEINNAEAFRLATESSREGDSLGSYLLGQFYDYGGYVPIDGEKAFSMYRDAAEKGHVDAQYRTGYFCREGIGTDRDPYEAGRWLFLASSQGHELASDILPGVRKTIERLDEEEARLSTVDTSDRAQLITALNDIIFFDLHNATSLNGFVSRKGLEIIRKAELIDDPEIQYIMYRCYNTLYNNNYLPEPKKAAGDKAIEFLHSAAKSEEYLTAVHELGKCYLEGHIVPEEVNLGLVHLIIAAGKGDVESMLDLSDIYSEGKIAEPDLGKALSYAVQAHDRLAEKDPEAALSVTYRIDGLRKKKEAEEERKKLEEEKRLAEQARKEEEARKKRRKDIWDEIEYNVYGVIAAAAMFLLLILYRKLGAGLFNEPVIPVHGLLRLILVVIAIGGTAYSALMMLMGILSAVGLEELSAVPAGLLALALAVGLKNQPKILAGLNYAALSGAALNLIILLIKLAKLRKK